MTQQSVLSKAFSQLSDRKVFRVAAAYAVGSWLLVEVATTVLPLFGAPDSVLRIIVLGLLIGFPVAVVLAWVYDVTSDGVVRTDAPAPASTKARVGDLLIIATLLVVVGALLYGRFQAPQEATRDDGSDAALAAELAATSADQTPSIAVLPFQNFSPDPANAMFGDGLAEELLNRLADLENLRVAARTSAFRFRNSDADISQIGAALNVTSLLEGSVNASGDTIRVTATLINVADGFKVWSQRFERKMTDVFAIQDEIAKAVADRLQVELLGAPATQAAAIPTSNLDAYRLYLRGRQAWHKRTSTSLAEAVDLFKAAIELDPQFALAYSGLADAYNFSSNYGNMPADESLEKSMAAAQKALELAPDLAEAHASMGQVYNDMFRFEQAGKAFARAVELKPNFAMAHMWLGSSLLWIDKRAALEEHRIAARLDPLSPIANHVLGESLWQNGDREAAEKQFLSVVEFAPEFPLVHFNLAGIARERYDYRRSIEHLLRANELDPGRAQTAATISSTYLEIGDTDNARLWLAKAEALGPNQQQVIYSQLNLMYSLKDFAGMRTRLEQIKASDSPWLPFQPYMATLAFADGDYTEAVSVIEAVFAGYASRQDTQLEDHPYTDTTALGLVYLANSYARSDRPGKAHAIGGKLLKFLAQSTETGLNMGDYYFALAGARLATGNDVAALETVHQLATDGWAGILRIETDNLFDPLRNELEFQLSIDQIRKNAKLARELVAAI